MRDIHTVLYKPGDNHNREQYHDDVCMLLAGWFLLLFGFPVLVVVVMF
jgi:hypothetical protein